MVMNSRVKHETKHKTMEIQTYIHAFINREREGGGERKREGEGGERDGERERGGEFLMCNQQRKGAGLVIERL